MKKFDLKVGDEELFELVKINKAYKKKISQLKQFLKKNNFHYEHDRDRLRKLVRHAKVMNDNLRIEAYALNDFLKLIELEVAWLNGDLTETHIFKLREELLAQKNRVIKNIREIASVYFDL